MKKTITLLFAALLISSVTNVFAQAVVTDNDGTAILTVESFDAWTVWGEVARGSDITVSGSFTKTMVGLDGNTYNLEKIDLRILNLTDAWGDATPPYDVTIAEGDALDALTFTGTITVPEDFPLYIEGTDTIAPMGWGGGHQLLQVRGWYDDGGATYTDAEGNEKAAVDVWANSWVGVIEGTGGTSISLAKNVVNMYPNPVKKGAMVTIDAAGLVEVYNVCGSKMLTSKSATFSTEKLNAGVYFVKAGSSKVSRLVVE